NIMANWGGGVQSREEQREMKRMAILRAAAQSFNTVGYHQTNLNDIAESLGVTKPALYRYIKSKEDILRQCLDIALKEIKTAIDDINTYQLSTERTGVEQLERFFYRFAVMSTDDFGACLILLRGSISDEVFLEQYRNVAKDISTAMEKIVRLGLQDGTIKTKSARLLVAAMLGALNEAVYWNKKEGRMSPEELSAKYFDIFVEGFNQDTSFSL
ncbi:MAG: TetR/AcrR family transcriptional regulator, partial [Chloroflexota bacterium]